MALLITKKPSSIIYIKITDNIKINIFAKALKHTRIQIHTFLYVTYIPLHINL